MNKANNKRRKESQQKIEMIFTKMLEEKELYQISVTEICKQANMNRSTFYANYEDVYDLAKQIKTHLLEDVMALYQEEWKEQRSEHNYLKLFQHIRENQALYRTYFKLTTDDEIFEMIGYSKEDAKQYLENQYVDYHIAFFASGLNGVIKKWLRQGCKETPEEIYYVIQSEYKRNLKAK